MLEGCFDSKKDLITSITYLSIKLIVQLKVENRSALVVDRILELLLDVLPIGCGDRPTSVGEIIHLNELYEAQIVALGLRIILKLHDIVLCGVNLPYGRNIVIRVQINRVFDLAASRLDHDVEPNLGIDDGVLSWYRIEGAEEQEGASDKEDDAKLAAEAKYDFEYGGDWLPQRLPLVPAL